MAVVESHRLTDRQSSSAASAAGSRGITKRIVRVLRLWRSRSRERRAFARLDDFALRDFAVSRWEVERELAKPFWRG